MKVLWGQGGVRSLILNTLLLSPQGQLPISLRSAISMKPFVLDISMLAGIYLCIFFLPANYFPITYSVVSLMLLIRIEINWFVISTSKTPTADYS